MIYIMDKYNFYKQYHNHPTNVLIHRIFIPIIVLTSMILLKFIKKINIILILFPFYLFYYFKLGINIGIFMMCYLLFFDTIASLTHQFSSNKTKLFLYTISLFILSWSAQFIGHYIEGKRPALLDNLSQAFIDAPLFSMDYLLICE